MTAVCEILRELVRVQALVFISHASPTRPATPGELSRWLRMPCTECEEVLDELASDGLIEPLPELRFASGGVHLTAIGAGFVEWMRDRAQHARVA